MCVSGLIVCVPANPRAKDVATDNDPVTQAADQSGVAEIVEQFQALFSELCRIDDFHRIAPSRCS